MKMVRRKGPIVAAVALLTLTGVGLGAMATSVTRASLKWQPPTRFAYTERVAPEPVDHSEAGRSWARAAYDGGLRRCPQMNASFVAACQAEMKALAARPGFVPGSYGGPLLVTKVEPVTLPEPYRAYEPEAMPLIAPEPELVEERTPDNYPAVPTPVIASEVKQSSAAGEPEWIASSLRSSQ
jgi:hypothetical protein